MDLISRQEAIDALTEIDEGVNIDIYTGEVKDILSGLPSVQEWIPVAERLPEVGEWVLCQCRANIFEVLKLDSDRSWVKDATHIYMGGFVLAWMPRPEPWKGEEK